MIPEAAVEAAAEWLPHSGDCEVRPERDCTCWQPRVNLMRAALEAAASHMLAEAWDEGRVVGMMDPHRIAQAITLAAPEYADVINPYRPTP